MLRILVSLALLWPATARAQSQPYVYTPIVGSFQQISSPATATGLTLPAAGSPAKIVEICVETQAIRYRDDGTAPTSMIGIPVAVGTCFQYSGNLAAIQFIQQASGAVIDVAYYR